MKYSLYYVIIIIIIINIIKTYLKKTIIDVFTDKEYLLLYASLNLIAILIYYLGTNSNISNIYNKYINLNQINHIKLIIISILPIIVSYYMIRLRNIDFNIYKSLL